ncbi:IucA/IucC family siderophore biosynthesis protein [Dactylosporangium sp. NPDC000244]|uniref:IucA/IucC family siderophore biosynthesis protein n=1 Tax=Dactylosporangium sp. NPDC000244 TaxID=3154365 RepID=UPI00331C1661
MDAPDVAGTAAALREHRPSLVAAFLASVPPARAAILTRLWGALWREQVLDPRRLGGPPPPVFGPPVRSVLVDGRAFDDPGVLAGALALGPGFRRELDNSVANLALAMTAPPSPFGGLTGAEQSIVDGHPLHPCCRTRIGLSTLDVLAYAPEHHPDVRLRIVETDPARWRTAGVPVPPRFPVHPWQLPRALASGLVRDTGVDVPARPLMSLRTLDVGTGHVKTAVEVQMTSAVRTLSAAAIHNGPLVSDLLAALDPGIVVLREVSAGTVLDDAGRPQRALGAVWRDAPPPDADVLPLALLPHRPDLLTPGFFRDLVGLLLPPLLELLERGVGLEAHGQNTLVEVAAGRPVRVYYRDLGGIHVHPGRLARAGHAMPPLVGALPTGDARALRTKVLASAFATVLSSLVAALGDEGLWGYVAEVAGRCVSAEDRRAVLEEDWPLKATTAMRLAADPLEDRWCPVPNPLRETLR